MVIEAGEDKRELLDDLAQAQAAVEARAAVEALDDPFQTCEYGHHIYRLVSVGEAPEEDGYHCERCGSTDPEGD